MPFHVVMFLRDGNPPEVALDLDEENLRRKFTDPFCNGQEVTINGRAIQAAEIGRFRITWSILPSEELVRDHLADRLAAGEDAPGRPDPETLANRGEDATEEFLTRDP